MDNFAKSLLNAAQQINNDIQDWNKPPEEGGNARTQGLISISLVRGTRDYIERVTHQINGCYENGLYDACSVMIRRLIETLIIEIFESHNMSDKIKGSDGNFFYLDKLIEITLQEQSWNLGRNAKTSLRSLKNTGDMSAHSRRYNAHRSDIDQLQPLLRVVVQEFISLGNLKQKSKSPKV